MTRQTSDSDGDRRGRAAAVLTVASAVLAGGGLLLTRVQVLVPFGILLFVLGSMGLIQAIALALGIVDFGFNKRDRDR